MVQFLKWYHCCSGCGEVELFGDVFLLGELHYCIYSLLKPYLSYSTGADKAQMDAMEIWSTTWASTLLLEANKFWFYSLLFSLASCLLQVYRFRPLFTPAGATARSKARSNILPWSLVRQILTDACDLLIPGSITGWARTSPAIVGLATVVSTLLASEEIWYRVQRAAAANVKALGKETQVKRKGKV